ncbi:MAG TPA: diaminopimelate epimerase [Polyangiaceae bacterium]|nr:diaminopimelate epimerase [Polyangiaceae bacterium]
MKFAKYHGLGNDYLVIEPGALGGEDPVRLAPLFCHRNYGIGSDGVLLGPLPSSRADFALRIINPDGSEAEKSGNGLRIFARYLWDTRRVGDAPFVIETKGGLAEARVLPEAQLVRMGMGQASFDSQVVGIAGARREVVAEEMEFAGKKLRCSGVSVGNPHCVISGVAVTEAEARALGPIVENDPRFLGRTNVQLLRVLDRANIEIQIWERGAGYTLASGSSASAAACAARRLGLCDGDVTVHMPGGQLAVEIDEQYRVTQTGPASKVAEGLLARESWLTPATWDRS